MALTLPTPTNVTEEQADLIIRNLESIRPISRAIPIPAWLIRVMQLRTFPDSDLDLLTCVTGRILSALPVTDRAVQWSVFVLLRSTPDSALVQKVLNGVTHMQPQIADLHRFAMGANTPTIAQLEVRLRDGSTLLLDNKDARVRLTPTQMDAVRAAYLRLVDAIVLNV